MPARRLAPMLAALLPVSVAAHPRATVAPEALSVTVFVAAERPPSLSPRLEALLAESGASTAALRPGTSAWSGGGVLISRGRVLTNHHVGAGARALTVTLHDGRRLPATLLGSDPIADVAVLVVGGSPGDTAKTTAGSLPAADLGTAVGLAAGDLILGVGHPWEHRFTLMAGIISATDPAPPDDPAQVLLQTDLVVGPGASGGPLFDERGRVIGLMTAMYAEPAGPTAISYAVPIDIAARIAEEISAHGRPLRATLGARVAEQPDGSLLVDALHPGRSSGLLPGDQLVSLDGRPLKGRVMLLRELQRAGCGAVLSLGVEREGRRVRIEVTTAQRWEAGSSTWEGLSLEPLAATERARLGLDTPGWVVEAVALPGHGLLPGDVLIGLQGAPLTDLSALEAAPHAARVTFRRGAQTLTTVVIRAR